MSYLLTYMMSGFNPFSVGGVEPTPQDLQNMLSQGNTATDNSLYNNVGDYNSIIQNITAIGYPFIHSTFGGGYVTLGDYPQSASFLPYVKVGYDGLNLTQVTIKPDGIEILSNGTTNTLKNDGGKDIYVGQTYILPSVNGQLQIQETPIVSFELDDLNNTYSPIIKQNTTFDIIGSLYVDDGYIVLDDIIAEQIRVYFLLNFSGGYRVYFTSPTLDIYTNWGDASVLTQNAVMMMRYGNSFYLKKINFPL